MQTITHNLRGLDVPLFARHVDRPAPYRAFVQMQEDGIITAGIYDQLDYADPLLVRRGLLLSWDVHPAANGNDLADLMESDKVQKLFRRVERGWRRGYQLDGLSKDAQDASDELTKIFAPESGNYTVMKILRADDWIGAGFDLIDLNMAGSVKACALKMRTYDPESIAILGDLEEAVVERADQMIRDRLQYDGGRNDVVTRSIAILADYNATFASLYKEESESVAA